MSRSYLAALFDFRNCRVGQDAQRANFVGGGVFLRVVIALHQPNGPRVREDIKRGTVNPSDFDQDGLITNTQFFASRTVSLKSIISLMCAKELSRSSTSDC